MQKEKRKIISQWLFPALVLIAVIAGMLLNFVAQSRETAAVNVENDMALVVERYAAGLNNDLKVMSGAVTTVGLAIAQIGQSNEELLAKVCEQSPMYMIVHCDSTGKGTTHEGAAADLSGTAYFDGLADSEYIYAEDDGVEGGSAIVKAVAIPDGSGDLLVAYYSLDNFGRSIRRTDFDNDFFYALLDRDGRILAQNEYVSNFLTEGNLFTPLEAHYNDELRKLNVRLQTGNSGGMKVAVGGERRSIIYMPLSVNEWTVAVGVNASYVDREERSEWSFTQATLFQLAIAVCAFLVILVVINMVSKMKNTESTKELMEKADTDLLTGLNNKLATERKIKEFMETHGEEQSMMFVLDIDNFKKINDTMGHAFGDEVLRSLGQQITAMFRVTDIVGRTGGDEFIILLKNIRDDELLKREAMKVARFFHDFKTGEYVKYSATASIGVAVFPKDGKDFEAMYKAADQALYMAKKRGKNQLAFYHDSLDAVVIK